ncbi:MAG TPA: DUF2950 family protein [Planctomycetota bacterium]|nr:DUF2950 family protein [Planctomycetota bacterium]
MSEPAIFDNAKFLKILYLGLALIIFLPLIASAVSTYIGRRIPNNQKAAVDFCKAYAEAQEQYRRVDHDGDRVLEYAQSLQELARVGLIPREAAAAELGAPVEVPHKGYLFRVLTAQSKNATGGARQYIVNGNMTLGYGLMGSPAVYDGTGRDTFVISNNGTIFQKDYGELETNQRLPTEFDPPVSGPSAE